MTTDAALGRGYSNAGHEKFLRSDGKKWSDDFSSEAGKETQAILEYLKTL